jgi:hypothetical protein
MSESSSSQESSTPQPRSDNLEKARLYTALAASSSATSGSESKSGRSSSWVASESVRQRNIVVQRERVENTTIPTPSVNLNQTFDFSLNIEQFKCADLSDDEVIEMYKDGRVFSQWVERWLTKKFPLIHVKGCKKYDHTDLNNENIKYEAKTFTPASGLSYAPSRDVGGGRTLNEEGAKERASNLIYTIVSNVNFPNIKVKFITGNDLMKKETELMKRKNEKIICKISLKHHDAFFA